MIPKHDFQPAHLMNPANGDTPCAICNQPRRHSLHDLDADAPMTPAPRLVGPGEVHPGNLITIPGLIPAPVTVEDVTVDAENHAVILTVWPAPEVMRADHPYPQPKTTRELNFGHWYAQYMVTLTVGTTHPVFVHGG